MTTPLPRPVRAVVALAAAAATLALAGCSGEPRPEDSEAYTTPAGMVEESFGEVALARPTTWTPDPAARRADRVASFGISDAGEVVGQMDVFVNELVTDRGGAELLAEKTMAEEMFHLRDREVTDRRPVVVAGAESAYLVEATYETTSGDPATYLQLFAVDAERDTVIVKITGSRQAADLTRWRTVLDTVRITG
jgi:hypothetical protein